MDLKYFETEQERADQIREEYLLFQKIEDCRGIAYRKDAYTSWYMPVIFESIVAKEEILKSEEKKRTNKRSASKHKRCKSRSKSKAKSSGGKYSLIISSGTELVKNKVSVFFIVHGYKSSSEDMEEISAAIKERNQHAKIHWCK